MSIQRLYRPPAVKVSTWPVIPVTGFNNNQHSKPTKGQETTQKRTPLESVAVVRF